MNDSANPDKAKLIAIYDRFLDLLWRDNAIPGPYVPYDLLDKIEQHDWPAMANEIVVGQLREFINGVNQFHTKVNHLDAWSRVVAELPEEEAWSVTISQATPIGYFCLNQPYALKERLINATTQILHQGNRRIDPKYVDRLTTDATDLQKIHWPTTSQKRKALETVGRGKWSSFEPFWINLAGLNSKNFERLTMNFRTGANHSIPPNFEQGEGPFVTRYMAPKLENRRNDDGTYTLVEHYDKPRPAYGFGGLPPLKISDAVTYCVEQHACARSCCYALFDLVNEIITKVRASG